MIRKINKSINILILLAILFAFGSSIGSAAEAIKTDQCYDCHTKLGKFPGIMADWENSEHAQNGVTCMNCHVATASDSDAMDHMGFVISPVVSPKDCEKCHPAEVKENAQSLHALGVNYYEALFDGEKLPYLESQIEGGYITVDGQDIPHAATTRGCQACHGTNMTGKSTDDPTVWPNNGIGRINPDGSKGSCSACHTRHLFSVAEARKPETCGQCHMGPDHPQIEMYQESKHGNIYASEGDSWNWDSDEWVAGVDYRAPTCAGCHMSVAGDVAKTHDVGARLSWELEAPLSRRTDNVANSLGVTIGDGSTWQEKQARMQTVCKQCHSTTWVEGYYTQADLVVELYNTQYTDTKTVMDKLYEDELLSKESFDEPIEFVAYEMWHHQGRRARMGAFMMAPDYVQWHGFYELLKDKVEIAEFDKQVRESPNTAEENAAGTSQAPGFSAIFAIAGLLAIAAFTTRKK